MLHIFAYLVTAALTVAAVRSEFFRASLNPWKAQYARGGMGPLLTSLGWFVVVYTFTRWALGPTVALVPTVILLVVAVAPWDRPRKTLPDSMSVQHGPVEYGKVAPIPAEPGEARDQHALVAPAPVLTNTDQETFEDLARRFNQD